MADDPKKPSYSPMTNVHKILRQVQERIDTAFEPTFEKEDDDVEGFKKATGETS